MKLTILGAGTAASQIPNVKTKFPPGYLLESSGEKILFECSEGIRFRLEQAGFKFTDIQHIAVTHVHLDHFQLPSFILSAWCTGLWGGKVNKLINLYAPKEVTKAYGAIMKIQVLDQKDYRFKYPNVKFFPVPQKKYRIGKNILSSAHVHHGYGIAESVAFRVENDKSIFVYSGDTGDCANIIKIARNADVFICEASALIGDFESSKNYGHLNPFLVGQICKQANVKKVIIVHNPGLDSDKAIIADCKKSGFKGDIACGKDFAIYNF